MFWISAGFSNAVAAKIGWNSVPNSGLEDAKVLRHFLRTLKGSAWGLWSQGRLGEERPPY